MGLVICKSGGNMRIARGSRTKVMSDAKNYDFLFQYPI